jgi:hypothetical protein
MDAGKQIFGAADLVGLGIKPTVAAVRMAYARIRRGELPTTAMPPLMQIPGNRNIQVSRGPFVTWLALFDGAALPPPPRSEPASGAGRRGRPTTVEDAEAKRQGVTVPELRRMERDAQSDDMVQGQERPPKFIKAAKK